MRHTLSFASAARPHWNEAKNPDFFLAHCVFLPSFLSSSFYPWDRRHPGLSGSFLSAVDSACRVDIDKKKLRQKNREKILSAEYSNQLPEGRELHTFLGHGVLGPDHVIFYVSPHQRIIAAFHARLVRFLTHFFRNAAFFMLDYSKKSFVIGFVFLARVFSSFLFFFFWTPFLEYVKLPCDKFFLALRVFPPKKSIASIVYHIRYCKFFSFFFFSGISKPFTIEIGVFSVSVKMLIKLLLLRHFGCLQIRITNCVVSPLHVRLIHLISGGIWRIYK